LVDFMAAAGSAVADSGAADFEAAVVLVVEGLAVGDSTDSTAADFAAAMNDLAA
jgi:hypothetical protein